MATSVQLHLGDCLEFMKSMPDKSVDAVITDPPYGISFQSARRTESERFAVLVGDETIPLGWVGECARVGAEISCLFAFCRWDVAEAFRVEIAQRWDLRSQVIWDRGNHGLGDLKRQYAPQHDTIWFATKGNWEFPSGRPKSVYAEMRLSGGSLEHPTQKPLGLMKKILEDITREGDTILDPFMGSGTTGVACVQTGRNFIGCEIDPGYFEIAKRRIEEAQMQIRMPI